MAHILAQFWGIVLVVCCIGLLVNKKLYNRISKAAQNEEFLFLYSLLALLIGALSISLFHVWAFNFEGIITLCGWSALLKGLAGIVFPDMSIQMVRRFQNMTPFIYGSCVLFLLFGVYLLSIGLAH